MKKMDLTWGESVIVRQRFVETFGGVLMYSHKEFESMSYTAHEGDPEVIELAKQCIKRQTGLEYKHILITNGATGGVTITLRAYNQMGYKHVLTRNPPYFSIYPAMIAAAGMQHVLPDHFGYFEPTVSLVDSPTNPGGELYTYKSIPHIPTIWDSVYHSNCYTPGNCTFPSHDVQVGSFSKLTGLNGLRLGWIATDDSLLYERLKGLVTAEYCGVSRPSGDLLLALLKGRQDRWCNFETMSRYWLDMNRTEWSKLERFFGQTPVSSMGMFYFAPVDDSARHLLDRAGVLYMTGDKFGHSEDYGRFNIGQDAKVIKAAVKAILKADKI